MTTSLGAAVALLVLAGLWVTVRGLMAREQLEGALPTAVGIRAALLSNDRGSLADEVNAVQSRTAQAQSLTSDPVWRTLEIVPLLGGNLRTVRQGAEVANELAQKVLPPLVVAADRVTPAQLVPRGGAVDVSVLARASKPLSSAKSAMDAAFRASSDIDTSGTVGPIAQPMNQLIEFVRQSTGVVDGLDAAVTLLPGMLGSSTPRHYLLLSLNSAELRSSGGIPGAVSVITADHGTLSIGASGSAAGLGRFTPTALPQSPTELALYQGLTGTWMQDVNLTPDFARAAQTASAMWQQRTGISVDGVIAVDPVALGYVLGATGPIDLGSGIRLDAHNASQVLLTDAYATFPDPSQQDAFFARVTHSVFGAVTAGSADPTILLAAIDRSVAENRIHVWSSDDSEQKVIAALPIAGTLPASTSTVGGFGIYLNDRTESKMDSYLRAAASVGSAACGVAAQPVYGVSVDLRSTVTAAVAAGLPALVVGAGVEGHPRGVIATNVFVYAPPGSEAVSVRLNGIEQGFTAATDAGRSVVGMDVVLDLGESGRLDILFAARTGAPTATAVEVTPMRTPFPVTTGVGISCVTAPKQSATTHRTSPERGTS